MKLSLARTRCRLFVALVRALDGDEVTPQELHGLLSQALGEETLAQKRARAGSAGGKRSAAARMAATGTAQPRSKTEAPPEPTPKQTPPASEARAEANPEASGPAAPPLRHLPSDPDPEISKSAVVSEGSDRSTRAANQPGATTPTDFESAMRETVSVRARLALESIDLCRTCRVNDWPEVIDITTTWHEAKGLPGKPRLRRHGEDPDVTAALEILALEYEPAHVERIARHLSKHPKFAHLALLRAVLKPETVKIAEGELAAAQPKRRPAPATTPPRAPDATPEQLRADAETARLAFLESQRPKLAVAQVAEDEEPVARVGAAE